MSAASLARLDRALEYRAWPDLDDAGRRQAAALAREMTDAGLRVRMIDPLKLNPDAPPKWDPRDWAGAAPDDPAAALDAATVNVDAMPAPAPAVASPATAVDGFPAPVQAALDALEGCGGLGSVAPGLAALAAACVAVGLEKGPTLAVQSATRLILKDAHKMLASEAAEQIAVAFAGADGGEELQGRRLQWTPVKPAEDPRPLAAILDSIVNGVTARVYLPDGAAATVAAYVTYCYAFERWPIRPLLALSSPVKQCGKTTLLDLLAMLIPRSYEAGGITAAALFRLIAAHRPILLLDEADQWLRGAGARSEKAGDLIACINAGWRIGGEVARCVGDEHEPRGFPVDTPKILAGIGEFPDTIADRAVILTLERKPGDLRLASVRADRPVGAEIRAQLTRWAADHGDTFAAADPEMGAWTNRAADNWRPLFVIADMAGGDWPERIRAAADAVTGRARERATSGDNKTLLLLDCRAVFEDAGCEFMPSAMLDGALHALEDRPWSDYRGGKPLSPHLRGAMLRGFGVQHAKHRGARGYFRAAFKTAWATYGAPPGSVPTVPSVPTPANVDGAADTSDTSDTSKAPGNEGAGGAATGAEDSRPPPPAAPPEADDFPAGAFGAGGAATMAETPRPSPLPHRQPEVATKMRRQRRPWPSCNRRSGPMTMTRRSTSTATAGRSGGASPTGP